MKKKHLLVSLLLLAMSTATVATATACKPEETPQENGVYYYDEGDTECLMTLSGKTFTLSFPEGVKTGAYEYDEEGNLVLVFDDDEALSATALYVDGVLTLNYNGKTYTFQRRVQYTVSYDVAGGVAMKSVPVIGGRTVAKPADPTKAGHVFLGWYADAAFTTEYDFAAPITANTTVYARFVPESVRAAEFNATFVVDGEVLATVKTINGKLYGVPTPVVAGKKFAGWWMSDYGMVTKRTTKYVEGQELTENCTMYAIWDDGSLLASVTETGVTWASMGANQTYRVEIIDANAEEGAEPISKGSVGDTKYDYDFSAVPAGDYIVTVTNGSKSTTMYYKNKALDKVSAFTVAEPSVLVFNAVAHATKYYVTVECGTEGHEHDMFDVGSATHFNFANCDMKEDGIKFTVTATADGYMDSVSETFVYSRELGAVTELKVDSATETLSWAPVAKATSYVVEIYKGDTLVVSENVANATSYDLKGLAGDLTISVSPVTKGYTAKATTITYAKKTLAAPANIALGVAEDASVLTWAAVEGATSYNVKVGDTVIACDTNSLTLSEEADYFVEGQTEYAFAVQAVGENVTSVYSNEFIVSIGGMSEISYNRGNVSWAAVAGATGYAIRINEGVVIKVGADVTNYDVTLTKAGVNTVSVTYLNANGAIVVGEYQDIEVYAYQVTLDFNGTGDDLVVYKAIGDKMNLPSDATRKGYTFGGWATRPDGLKNNGELYTDSYFQETGSIVLFVNWIPKTYTVNLVVTNTTVGKLDITTAEVKYGEEFTLPVPEILIETYSFDGWFASEGGLGYRYTDNEGTGTTIWNEDLDEAKTLYAGFLDQTLNFIEVLDKDGNVVSYEVEKGTSISKVSEITIPKTFKTLPVVGIRTNAFSSCTTLETINIPDTIEVIEVETAFNSCSKLRYVNVYQADEEANPDAVYYSVDGVLFKINSQNKKELAYFPRYTLKAVEYKIPEGTQIIPVDAFKYNYLTKIIVPYTVEEVQEKAFYYSYDLVEIVFEDAPEGTTASLSIGDRAFYYNSDLTTVKLPAHLTAFHTDAFYSCSKLEAIEVSDADYAGRKYASTADGMICSADKSEIVFCPRAKAGKITFSNAVTKIGEGAFETCTKITGVTISKFVQEIKTRAFKGCTYIESVTFEGDHTDLPLAIRASAFYGCNNSKFTEITLPENLKVLEKHAFGGCTYLETVNVNVYDDADITGDEIKFAVNAFGTDSTSPITYVENLVIGKYCPAIPDFGGVFGASKLVSVVVDPENKYYAAQEGVLYNKEMTELLYYPKAKTGEYIMPATVTKIGAGVFKDNDVITAITINNVITEIGEEVFYGCGALSEIMFAPGGTEDLVIAKKAFYQCTGMKKITLPDRLVEIGESAFAYNDTLVDITFGAGDKELVIGKSAFQDCDNLKEVNIPGRVSKIGDNAFDFCAKLEKVTLNEGLKEIGDSAFYRTWRLGNIHIPASCTKLGVYKDTTNNVEIMRVFSSNNATMYVSTMTAITVAEGNTAYAAKDGMLYKKDADGALSDLLFCPKGIAGDIVVAGTVKNIWPSAFSYNPNITSISFEETETVNKVTIGFQAFYNCTKLKQITLPAGLEEIASRTFYNCALEKVVIPNTVIKMGKDVFDSCDSLAVIEFEEGGTKALEFVDGTSTASGSRGAFGGLTNLQTITLPERVSNIAAYLFYGCTGLKSVNIPASVTTIGKYAFAGTSSSSPTNLETITFAENSKLTTINDYAFYCSGLKSITLPDSVTTLGGYCFRYAQLETVTIPKNVQYLGGSTGTPGYIFANCLSLKQVNFPADGKLKRIGYDCFYRCEALESITIPATVEEIGKYAFQYCEGLKTVTFATKTLEDGREVAALKKIGDYAFNNCISLTELVFPTSESGNIEMTNAATFTYCKSLKKVVLSSSIKSFGTALKGIPALEEIVIAEDNESLAMNADNTILFDKSFTTVYYATQSLTGECVLPSTVVSIDDNAFEAVAGMTKITIPAAVKEIGKYAFSECAGLAEVTIEAGSSLTQIGSYAFNKCTSLAELILPEGLVAIGDVDSKGVGSTSSSSSTFAYCSSLKKLVLPSTLKYIGTYAFRSCTALKELVLPEGLVTLGNSAFQSCGARSVTIPSETQLGTNVFTSSQLQTAVIASGRTEIPNNLFYSCSYLKQVTIPDTVTKIGNYAFYNCKALESLDIPAGVTSIGNYAFQNCGLKSVKLPQISSLGTSMFYGCSSLTSIVIPDSVTNMGTTAFYGCTSLKSVTLPKNITDLGDRTFYNCQSLQSFAIPEGVTALKASLFYGCISLTKVTLPNSLTDLGKNTFQNCSSLKSIELTPNITELPDYVFSGCGFEEFDFNSVAKIGVGVFQNNKFKTLNLSANIKSLANYAFDNNDQLTTVVAPGLEEFGNYVFRGCAQLTNISFPELKEVGTYAFQGSALVRVELPKLETAGSYTFQGTEMLIEAKLPALKTGGTYMFAESSVNKVEFGSSLQSLPNYCFQNATGLKNVDWLADTIEFLGTYTFRYSSIESIKIPAGVKRLGTALNTCTLTSSTYLFDGCEKLKSVDLNNVTQMAGRVFSNTPSLTAMDLSKVTEIGSYCFQGSMLAEANLSSCDFSGGTYQFEGIETLKKVILKDNLTSIPNYAFNGCINLEEMVIPDSVEEIGSYAFTDCAKLVPTIPTSLKEIGARAYAGTAIVTAAIPGAVTSLKDGVFLGCSNLTTVTFAEGSALEEISVNVFLSCSKLTPFAIPASVKSIGADAFAGCDLFTAFQLEEGSSFKIDSNGAILDANNVLVVFPTSKTGVVTLDEGTTLRSYSFDNCTDIEKIILPASVTTIPSYAFRNCHSVTEIVLPATVTSIDSHAFDDCRSLATIALPASLTTINSYAFTNAGIKSLTIPSSIATIGTYAFSESALESVVIESIDTTIGNYAFKGCASLASVTLPEGLKTIGYGWFQNCTALETLAIPETVTKLESYCFSGAGFKTFTLPESITTLGTYVFKACPELTTFTWSSYDFALSSSVGGYMFEECPKLETVNLPETQTTLAPYMFRNCSSLASWTFHKNIKEVPAYCFYGTGIKKLVIPETLEKFSSNYHFAYSALEEIVILNPEFKAYDYCFYMCENLSKVTLPAGMKTMYKTAWRIFQGCHSLKSFTFPEGFEEIGSYMFQDSGLESIVIPESINYMGTYTFTECANLKTVDYRTTLAIANYAFQDCTALTQVTLAAGLDSIGSYAFSGCTSLKSIVIPKSVGSITASAFEGWGADQTIYFEGSEDECGALVSAEWECNVVFNYVPTNA